MGRLDCGRILTVNAGSAVRWPIERWAISGDRPRSVARAAWTFRISAIPVLAKSQSFAAPTAYGSRPRKPSGANPS